MTLNEYKRIKALTQEIDEYIELYRKQVQTWKDYMNMPNLVTATVLGLARKTGKLQKAKDWLLKNSPELYFEVQNLDAEEYFLYGKIVEKS